jgi:hypothetical protein
MPSFSAHTPFLMLLLLLLHSGVNAVYMFTSTPSSCVSHVCQAAVLVWVLHTCAQSFSLWLLQVQMQADVRAVMSGHQQQRHFSSIRSVASALIQQHGIAGLWRGGLPAVQRAALVNLGELSTYDTVRVSPVFGLGFFGWALKSHSTSAPQSLQILNEHWGVLQTGICSLQPAPDLVNPQHVTKPVAVAPAAAIFNTGLQLQHQSTPRQALGKHGFRV